MWVAVTNSTVNYAYSTDNLATTSAQTFPAGFTPNRVCFTGTHFVAFQDTGRAAYSTTGLTGSWTVGNYVTGSPSADWIGIASGNGVVVVRRNGSATGGWSNDNGATWNFIGMPLQSNVTRLTFAAAKFAIAGNSTTNACIYSTNGASWSSISVATPRDWEGIAPFGNFAVSVNGNATVPNYAALWNLGYDNPDTPLLIDTKQTQGVIPKVMLRWSDDGGHTWSNEHWREVGRMVSTETG